MAVGEQTPHAPIKHWEMVATFAEDERQAARWAWSRVAALASAYCTMWCGGGCSESGPVDSQVDADRWLKAQEELHDALRYLPHLPYESEECPACQVAKAFRCFAKVKSMSPVAPVHTVRQMACEGDDIAFIWPVSASVPCCRIEAEINDLTTVLVPRIREDALLHLDIDALPVMPPALADSILPRLRLGQSILSAIKAIADGCDEPSNSTQPLRQLLTTVEKHRLTFLMVASANRRNPNRIVEHIRKADLPGWDALSADVDDAGEFLIAHRAALDAFADEAYSQFGPGKGFPSEPPAEDSGVADQDLFPHWSLDEMACPVLESSSRALLRACERATEADVAAFWSDVVKDASTLTYAEGQSQWCSCVLVEWVYLDRLDSVSASIKRTLAKALSSHQDSNALRNELVAMSPTALVSAHMLRDIIRIRRIYPDALDQHNSLKMQMTIMSELESVLQLPSFAEIRTLYERPKLGDVAADDKLTPLIAVLGLCHPLMAQCDFNNRKATQAAIAQVFSESQESASPKVQKLLEQLFDIRLFNCRVPSESLSNPKRLLYLIRCYWEPCKRIIHDMMRAYVHFVPNPALRVIVNLRSRIDVCLDALRGVLDVEAACADFAWLLDVATSDDPDVLSYMEDETRAKINAFDLFIETNRQQAGYGFDSLDLEEALMIEYAEKAVSDHCTMLDRGWADIHKYVPKQKERSSEASGEEDANFEDAVSTSGLRMPSDDLHNVQNTLLLPVQPTEGQETDSSIVEGPQSFVPLSPDSSSLPAGPEEVGQSKPADLAKKDAVRQAPPEPQPTSVDRHNDVATLLPTAIAAAILLRNIISIRRDYPDAMDAADALHLQAKIMACLEDVLQLPAFSELSAQFDRPSASNLTAEPDVLKLMAGLLSLYPSVARCKLDDAAIWQALHLSHTASSVAIGELRDQLWQIRNVHCKIPDQSFADPQRLLGLISNYWKPCKEVLHDFLDGEMDMVPGPLVPIILNLKARIELCLGGLASVVDVTTARFAFTWLLDTLMSDEPFTLSVDEEIARAKIFGFDRFIETSILHVGHGKCVPNEEERLMLDSAEQRISACRKERDDELDRLHLCGTKGCQDADRQEGAGSPSDVIKHASEKSDDASIPAPATQPSADDERLTHSTVALIDMVGRKERRRSLVRIGAKEAWLTARSYGAMEKLVDATKTTEQGWLSALELAGPDDYHQVIRRLRLELLAANVDGKALIQSNGEKQYRLSVPAACITAAHSKGSRA